MNMLSTIMAALLILFGGISAQSGETPAMPVSGDVDLSSTFCDFRPLHFHGGIDIRTGGKDGREILSPVDGYIWRIRYAYYGYGKGLYVKDSAGNIYVFGHLSRLSERLEKIVHNSQYARKRYYLEDTFPADSLPVKKGELIAYSGQTGSGSPHLHFEMRNPANEPVNPLTNGFAVRDFVAPVFERVGVIYMDSSLVFEDGFHRQYFAPRTDGQKDKYSLDKTLFLRGAFGIMIDVSDRIRADGPKLNIKKARLFIDDLLYYETDYEKYNYDRTAAVDLSYDYYEALTNGQYWQVLFNPEGKNFESARSPYQEGGIFSGKTEFSHRLHHVRIEIYDAADNKSTLEFDFYYYALPTAVFEVERVDNSLDTLIYLRSRHDLRQLDIMNIEVSVNSGRGQWEKLDNSHIRPMGDWYEVNFGTRFRHESALPKVMRVALAGQSGWKMVDGYFVLDHYEKYTYHLDYKLIDNGILFSIKCLQPYAPAPRLDIVYEDGYIRSIKPVPVGADAFAAFYKNEKIQSRIIRLELNDDYGGNKVAMVETNIILAGASLDRKMISFKDFSVSFGQSSFYSPAFIEIKEGRGQYPLAGNIVGKVYTIDPGTIPLAGEIILAFQLPKEIDRTKIGLYRLNSKNEWKWLNATISEDKLEGRSALTGTFAVLLDTGAPVINNISPANGKTVFTPYPTIKCEVTDGLAHIEDDNNITILLDGRWQIPEYDPETRILKFTPDKKLETGRHELIYKVSDRVGNEKSVKSNFMVSEKKKKK